MASQGKKSNAKRTGHKKAKIAHYYDVHYAQNKLRRILDRNGESAAWAWADAHSEGLTLRAMLGRGRPTN